MLKPLLIVAAMSAVFCIVAAVFYLAAKSRIKQEKRLDTLRDKPGKTAGELRRAKKEEAADKQPAPRLQKLADELYVGGIALRAGEFVAIWIIAAVGLPVLLLFLGANILVCTATALVGAAAPIAYVKYKRRKKLQKIDRQLVDAIALISNSLRAGLSFQAAMQCIADEMEEPISKEFGRVCREVALGMTLENSFAKLLARTGNKDLELVCNAVLIQRQIGGNLAEVLDNISGTIAERIRMRGEIKALTASGTLSGYIIGALPIFLLIMMMFLNPGYVDMFFTTTIGYLLLGVSAVLETVGFLIVRKIVNIKM